MSHPTFPISHLLICFFVFRPPTHFSHMSHPTFPISHLLFSNLRLEAGRSNHLLLRGGDLSSGLGGGYLSSLLGGGYLSSLLGGGYLSSGLGADESILVLESNIPALRNLQVRTLLTLRFVPRLIHVRTTRGTKMNSPSQPPSYTLLHTPTHSSLPATPLYTPTHPHTPSYTFIHLHTPSYTPPCPVLNPLSPTLQVNLAPLLPTRSLAALSALNVSARFYITPPAWPAPPTERFRPYAVPVVEVRRRLADAARLARLDGSSLVLRYQRIEGGSLGVVREYRRRGGKLSKASDPVLERPLPSLYASLYRFRTFDLDEEQSCRH